MIIIWIANTSDNNTVLALDFILKPPPSSPLFITRTGSESSRKIFTLDS